MNLEVEFQITPAMSEKMVLKALLDEPYGVSVEKAYTTGWILVESDDLNGMRDKLSNLAGHIEQADPSKQYVIDFVFKVEMTF